MIRHNSECGKEYGFRKDHKPGFDEERLGHPMRPMCDVSDAYNHRLSYLICKVITHLTDNIPTQCNSTEELMASINEMNDSQASKEDSVIGSLDVKSLYPSLDIKFAIEVVCEEFYKNETNITGVDIEEVGLYIAINRSTDYIRNKSLQRFCPMRRHNARQIQMTGSGIQTTKEKRFRPWFHAQDKPDDDTSKQMLKEALKIALELILNNHYYKFNDIIRKQEKGGPIGLDLTGVVAKIFMGWWDRVFLQKLRDEDITVMLYERYVDDTNMCVKGIQDGDSILDRYPYNQNNTDPPMNRETLTFQIIKEIGESIHDSIKLEVDVPSNHGDQKLPILDLKVWIEKNETNGHYEIVHEHYIKDTASKLLINVNSALAWAQTRTILTQLCLRVMLNCSHNLSEDRRIELLQEFCKRMQASGYDKKMRYEILKSADVAYNRIIDSHDQGDRPMYRRRQWNKKERQKQRLTKGNNWYQGHSEESVIFVHATPGSELAKLYKQKIRESALKIKVVEKAGVKVRNLLQKNGIMSSSKCNADGCMICRSDKGKNCRKSGITYKILCQHTECKFCYNGQTGKNGFSRGLEHIRDYQNKEPWSVLWTHCKSSHASMEQQFKMVVVDQCRNKATKRQILETVRINASDAENRMNERVGWRL